MNTAVKHILETALVYEKSIDVRNAALDEMFTKLIVRPIQLAWREKTGYRKRKCYCCYNHDD